MNRSIPWGIANGAAAGALWGVIFLVPAVLHGFNPLQLALGRYLAYGALSLVVLLPRIRHLSRRLVAHDWISLLWLSLTGNLVYYALVAFAVQSAGGAATSLVVGLVPVVIAQAASSAPGAVPLRRLAAALSLSVIGVCLIAWQALSSETMNTPWAARCLGLFCAACALVSWSAYSIGNSRALARLPDVTGHDWSLLTGLMTGFLALLCSPLAWVWQGAAHTGGDWSVFWLTSTGVAVLASILGSACWNRASRILPLSLSGQMIVFETLFALVYTFAWQRRWPTGMECVAMVCLLAGVVLCARAHRHRETRSGNRVGHHRGSARKTSSAKEAT